ncbi:MAG: Oligoendopeptidase F, plasmid [Chlamydiae bacterium]|nr:Oligoendopeptidase F, plasmid [Chlamydiota bacterium]
MAKKRDEIDKQDRWNVENIFPTLKAWEQGFQALIKGKSETKRWPELAKYQGKFNEGAETLSEFLKKMFYIERDLIKLYTYAHLRHDEDVANEPHKEMYDRISLLYYDFQNETSWVQSDILQLPDKIFERYLSDSALKEHHIFLEKISLERPYTLTADKEYLISLAGKALETPEKVFSIFNNADLKFGTVEDKKGEQRELTHGSYGLFLQAKDRTLRKNAALKLHQRYGEFENTVSELINGQVQRHIFHAKAHNYPSSLHAALTPHQIPIEVYHTLIDTVHKNLPVLHRYVSLRKKLLGVDQLHFHDLYVSLVPDFEKHYSFAEAEKMVLQAVQPLGEEYQQILKKGFEEERWVDRFENAQKRSGAYSSGCYDSSPYILMNFQGTLRDVMVLAHEAGHSMHSYYTNKAQPFHTSHYPIFVAEVASTFNEELLFRLLLERAESKKERCYLLNQKLDDIRATLFRQTQFAEFELSLHTLAEKGVPLTASSMKTAYRKLNQEYYGADLYIDPEIDVEFLRIPHFYYNFYVYQYATGISAAYALVERLMKEGESARKEYFQFLSSGSARYPVDLLEMAGVDMRDKSPIQTLISRFDALITEFESEFST